MGKRLPILAHDRLVNRLIAIANSSHLYPKAWGVVSNEVKNRLAKSYTHGKVAMVRVPRTKPFTRGNHAMGSIARVAGPFI